MFQMRDEIENPEFDAEAALKSQLARVEESLSQIRMFNARVPLNGILRLVFEDPNYRPRELAGGEDWYAIFKGFWKDRIDRQLALYAAERRLQDLESDIAGFLGTKERVRFSHISEEGGDGTPPVKLERALAFLSCLPQTALHAGDEPGLQDPADRGRVLQEGQPGRVHGRV